MRFPPAVINDVGDLLAALQSHRQSEAVWYRGQSRSTYTLLPSLGRKPFEYAHERALMTKFKQNALPFLLRRPDDEWDWLFLGRHYGLPTRLLDWSESPLVALYFALGESKTEWKQEGVLWALLPGELNKLAGISPKVPFEIPAFGDDTILDNYRPSRIAAPGSSLLLPAAAIAFRDFPRMQAQHSVFTISHLDQTPIDQLGTQQHVWSYSVPAARKAHLRLQLVDLAITRLALFPELDNVAALAKASVK